MQSLLLDVSRQKNNTIHLRDHERIGTCTWPIQSTALRSVRREFWHQVTCPHFPVRDIALKSAPEFSRAEKKMLDLIYAPPGKSEVEWSGMGTTGKQGLTTPPQTTERKKECARSGHVRCATILFGASQAYVKQAVYEQRPYVQSGICQSI